MPAALNNIACPDQYTSASTVYLDGAVRINLLATGNSVFLQWAPDRAMGWNPEEFYPIGKYSFDRKCGVVRVRNAVAAGGARATVLLYTASDLS